MSDTSAATYSITVELDGEQHSFPCRSDQTVLAAAEAAGVMIPSSCCAGVCTTCAARIGSGEVHQPDAMGVKDDLRKDGFATCVAFPVRISRFGWSGGCAHEAQFGQYQGRSFAGLSVLSGICRGTSCAWLLEQLRRGEPLRWAITAGSILRARCLLQVEAVLIR